MWLETLWSQPQCSYLWMEIKQTFLFSYKSSVLNSTNIIMAIKTSVCIFWQADMIHTPRMRHVPPVAAGYTVTISACCDQDNRVLGNRRAQGYKSINSMAKIRIEEDAEALKPPSLSLYPILHPTITSARKFRESSNMKQTHMQGILNLIRSLKWLSGKVAIIYQGPDRRCLEHQCQFWCLCHTEAWQQSRPLCQPQARKCGDRCAEWSPCSLSPHYPSTRQLCGCTSGIAERT